MSTRQWTAAAVAVLLLASAGAPGREPASKAKRSEQPDPELQMGMEHAKVDMPQDALVVIPFRNSTDALGSHGRAILDRSIAQLNQGSGPLQIAGHTSGLGRAHANQLLSERRAKMVKDYLVEHGIAAERLSIVGYGASQPIDTNETYVGRRHNRRVEIKAGGN